MFNRAADFHGGALLLQAVTLQWRFLDGMMQPKTPSPQTVRTSQRNKFRAPIAWIWLRVCGRPRPWPAPENFP
jgi:hypothetical protein